MKPSDVTEQMTRQLKASVDMDYDANFSLEEVIAASVNAAFSDDTPISACEEYLLANGWKRFNASSCFFRHSKNRLLEIDIADGEVSFYGAPLPTKTIGQLRALEIGLGLHT